MKNSIFKKITAITIAAVLTFSISACSNSSNSIKFGTAAVGGMYSAFASAYAQIISDNDSNLNISVRSTAGSAANIRLLSEEYIQLAIAQADLVDAAYNGTGDFTDNPLKGYSAIASLYSEACQIVVRADSDITSPDDLLGKTVSVGEEESGSERNALQILQAYGLSKDLLTYKNLDYSEAAEALLNGEIDAMFVTAGTQTSVIEELAKQENIRLLSLDSGHIAKLKASYSFLAEYTIPANTYTGVDTDIKTVGVESLLLASDSLDAAVVEQLTTLLFDHSSEIQYSLPLDFDLDIDSATENVTIPFHQGAYNYYKSNGVIVEE